MFKIPTYVAPSTIQGVGVFALETIRKGDIVWAFDPATDLVIPFEEVDLLPLAIKDHILNYSYLDRDISKAGYIYSSDNAKFTNHSAEPNIRARGTIHTALHDIAAGEELTCDYRLFDWDGGYEIPAYAGDGQPSASVSKKCA